MSSYRFCRTDDIGLLVDALNRCWAPYFPDEPLMTPTAFKRSIRDLQVWCSSCMVAFSGPDPIGVLIRRQAAVRYPHPQDRRSSRSCAAGPWPSHADLAQLETLDSGAAPNRSRSPRAFAPACELFNAAGYVQETLLTDYVLEGPALSERGNAARVEGFVIPVTIDDLAANGLLGEADPQVCWQRSIDTLTARKDDIAGLAVATDEQIEAYILYMKCGEILALQSFVADEGARLQQLLSRIGTGTFRLPKVHPEEISKELVEMLGFRPASEHRVYAATARSD